MLVSDPSLVTSLLLPQTTAAKEVSIGVGGQSQIKGATPELRDVWEETAFVLERLQVGRMLLNQGPV